MAINSMRYNLYIDNGNKQFNFLAIDEAILNKLVSAYNNGDESLFFLGKNHLLGSINEIQIYEFENEGFKDGDTFFKYHVQNNNIKRGFLGIYIPKSILEVYGKRVTEDYIKGEYGYVKKERFELAKIHLKIPNTISRSTNSEKKSNTPSSKANRKVFIVHGHDDAATSETARFIEQLKLIPIILREQPSAGNTIIEKIEANSDVGFGIVLYTECDLGTVKTEPDKLKFRARQNVVFEHGYLIGRIKRKNVCALVKGNIETPNDISGVVYVKMDSGWKMELFKELKNSGFDIDANNII